MEKALDTRPYPDGLDCVWLASDRYDHVGAFVTAGIGPIPDEALRAEYVAVEDVEKFLLELPKRSSVRLLSGKGNSFSDLAERGVFVFDWPDANRRSADRIIAYEAVAVPGHPIVVPELPLRLGIVAAALKFTRLAFAKARSVPVDRHMTCSN